MPQYQAEAEARKLAALNQGSRVGKKTQAGTQRASEEAGAAVGVGERYVREAVAVKQADPEVFAQVKAGDKSLKQAAREASRRRL